MWKRAIGLAVAGALCVLLQGCDRSNSGSDTNTLTISVNSWAGFGPLYVAKERGFFGDLDVRIVRIDDSATRRANLANGATQILGSTIDDLAVINSIGRPASAIGCADYSNGADGILGAGSVTSLAELSRAQVAVDRGFVNHFFLLYVLDRNGYPVNGLRLAQMKPDDAGIAFSSGRVDAAVTWQPHISTALQRRQGAVLLASTRDYPEAIVDLYVAEREWADAHPELLRRFRDGWDRAVQFTRSNPRAAYGIMSQRLNISEADLGAIFQDVGLLTTAECRTHLGPRWNNLSSAAVRLWRQAGILRRDVDLRSSLALD